MTKLHYALAKLEQKEEPMEEKRKKISHLIIILEKQIFIQYLIPKKWLISKKNM